MNEKRRSTSFLHRVLWYVLITVVVQVLLGIGLLVTTSFLFAIPIGNFAWLLPWLIMLLAHTSVVFPLVFLYIMFGLGTFFMFLIVMTFGEIHHRLYNSEKGKESSKP